MMNQQMQAFLRILLESQWLPYHESQKKQMLQLERLVKHAYLTVPFYREYYSQCVLQGPDLLQSLPVLTRDKIQLAGDGLISTAIPELHGQCYSFETSGSTGKPVNVLGTDFSRLVGYGLMLREQEWHQRDMSKLLMGIRWEKPGVAEAPKGQSNKSWGAPFSEYYETGPSVTLNVASKIQDQIEAIIRYQPVYLISYPSNIAAIAEYCLAHQISLPSIQEISLKGEALLEHYSDVIQRCWPQAKVVDTYSTEELGSIACYCPEYGRYHLYVERVLMEIVNDSGEPCAVGEVGKVLLTSLVNYATPLIRYDIGDYAEWGELCPCGRGLPVIKKIYGRKRNRLRLPNGESRFPYLGEKQDTEHLFVANQIKQFQYVQHTETDIEIKLVVDKQLTKDQENDLISIRQQTLGYPFNITVTYHNQISVGSRGKYEEFISHVA